MRRSLGIRAFGANGWLGDVGELVVPPHEEDSGNEELSSSSAVAPRSRSGRISTRRPPARSCVVPPDTHRAAVAAEDGTIVLAVGATRGEPFEVHGWDDFTVAEALRNAGRNEEARAVMADALASNPAAWGLAYNTACWESLDGEHDAAFDHLRRAMEMDEREVKEMGGGGHRTSTRCAMTRAGGAVRLNAARLDRRLGSRPRRPPRAAGHRRAGGQAAGGVRYAGTECCAAVRTMCCAARWAIAQIVSSD